MRIMYAFVSPGEPLASSLHQPLPTNHRRPRSSAPSFSATFLPTPLVAAHHQARFRPSAAPVCVSSPLTPLASAEPLGGGNSAPSLPAQPKSTANRKPLQTDWTALSRAGRYAVRRARDSQLPLGEALRAEADANPENPFVWHAAAVHEARVVRSRSTAHHVLDAAMDAVPAGRRAALFLARAEITPDAEAVSVLREGIEEANAHAPLYWALANVYGRLGDIEGARGIFEEGFESLPESSQPQILRSWAVFEHNFGFPVASLKLWRQAVELDPADAVAWKRYAEAEENCGEGHDASLAVLRRAVVAHPLNSDLRIAIARLEERINGAGAARQYLDDANFEGDQAVTRSLAMLEMKEGNFDRARILFRRAADLEALDGSEEGKYAAPGAGGKGIGGRNRGRGGNRRRKRDYIGAPHNRTARSAKSLHAWALMEVKVGDIETARKLLLEADSLAPEDPAIWRALAEIESRERNYSAARSAFERATAIDDSDMRLWLAWGKTESLAGNYQAAEKLLLTAIDRFERFRNSSQSRAAVGKDVKAALSSDNLDVTISGPYPPVQSRVIADALKELASIAVQQGDVPKAVDLLGQATKIDPSYDSAWRVLSEHLLRLEGIGAVRDLYRRALGRCNRKLHARLLHWWATEERNARCYDEARDLLKQATDLEPTYMSAWLSWALVEKAMGSVDRACEVFASAAEHATRSSVRSPYIFHAWGRVEELKRGDVDRAREIFRKGCQLSPRSGMLLHAWGQMEDRCGRLEAARDLFNKAVQIEPGNGFNWQAWGMLEARRRNYEKAAELFKTGSTNDPKNGGILASWAMMEGRDLGNEERGRELFEAATTADSNNATAWHSWGSLEVTLGNYDLARQLYLRAAKACPTDPISWNALGVLEAEHGTSLSRPVEYFEQATSVDSTHAISYQAWALFAERKKLDVAEARRLYMLGVEKCDADGQGILYQAWAVMEQRQGSVAEARELLKRGLDVDRRRAELWATYALLEKTCGNRKIARRLFQDACSAVVPVRDIAAIYAAWGTMEAEAGSHDEARTLFQRGLRINPRHEPLWRSYASMEEQQGNLEKAAELRSKATGCPVSVDDLSL